MSNEAELAVKQLVERLLAALPADRVSSMSSSIDLAARNMRELASASRTDTEAARQFSHAIKATTDNIARSGKTTAQQNAALDAAIKKTTDGIKDSDLTRSLAEQARAAYATSRAEFANAEAVKRSEESQKNFRIAIDGAKNAFDPFSRATSTVISGYQSSGSQISTAASITTAGLQLTTDGLNKTSSGLLAAGAATAGATSKIGKLGSGAMLVGGALTGLFGAASGLALKILPTLTTEMNNYITGFQSLSLAGALFTGGLQGMADAGKNAGLNLSQFSNVVKTNQGALAASGLGVGEAAKKMGNVGAVFDKDGAKMRKSLLNLGYTYEEQAGLVAETMAMMRQGGGPLDATDQQIAEQTMKYADNLRLIATVTGDDAKGRMKAAQDAANSLAFQQKMDGMTAEQKADAVAAMAIMSQAEKKAFMEFAVNGQAMTVESAAFVNQFPAVGIKLQQSIEALNAGTLDGQKQLQINADNQAAINKDLMDAKGLARANMAGVGGLVGNLGQTGGAQKLENDKYTAKAIADAKKNLEDQKNQGDETLQGKMNRVIVANQEATIEIQNAILKSGVMQLFADTVRRSTAALTDMIKSFSNGGSSMETVGEILSSPAGLISAIGGFASILGTVKTVRGGPGVLGGPAVNPSTGLDVPPKPPTPGSGGGISSKLGTTWEATKSFFSGSAGATGTAGATVAEKATGIAGAAKAGATGLAGAATTDLAKGVGGNLLKRLPLVGSAIAGGMEYMESGQLGRSLAAGIGSGLGMLGGGVAGTALGPAGTVAGTVAGGYAGQEAGTALYDWIFGKNKPVPGTPAEKGAETSTLTLSAEEQKQRADAEKAKADSLAQQKMQEADPTKDDTKADRETRNAIIQLNKTMKTMSDMMGDQLELLRDISNNTRNTVMAIQ